MSELLFSLVMLAVFLLVGITEKGLLKWIMYLNVAVTLFFILSGEKITPLLAIVWIVFFAIIALELVGKYIAGLIKKIQAIKLEEELASSDAMQGNT